MPEVLPYRLYFLNQPLVALLVALTMLVSAVAYFGLAREFYRDSRRVPFWYVTGLVALTTWGGAACLLTALCYALPLYTWLLVTYATNSLVVMAFYLKYRRRNFEVRIIFHDESEQQFMDRVRGYWKPRH